MTIRSQIYERETGVSAKIEGLCVHSLRATAATNVLEDAADYRPGEEWLGYSNISTIYDRRKRRPEDSSTLRMRD